MVNSKDFIMALKNRGWGEIYQPPMGTYCNSKRFLNNCTIGKNCAIPMITNAFSFPTISVSNFTSTNFLHISFPLEQLQNLITIQLETIETQ